ncbi:MAG: hydrogenase maturation protease [Desulfobacteraceae bacterium]|jgi:hydrogenase maturation protease
MKRTLVMGIGNLLLSDNGVGVHVAHFLSKRRLPAGIDVLDVGTAFFDALPAMEKAERIVIIDAVKAGGKPGDIYRLPFEKSISDPLTTLHSFDIFGMLDLTDNPNSVQIVLIGVEPEKLDWGIDLSLSVSQVLPDLLDLVCDEIGI